LGGSQVVVAAAARSIYDIDTSLRSPSAFKTKLELFPPNAKQREDILRQILGTTSRLGDLDFTALAERTHGFVGRDIHDLCLLARDQREQQIDESISEEEKTTFDEKLEQTDYVRQEDFDAVFGEVQPTVLKDSILEVPKVRWTDIAGLDHVRAVLEAITIRPFKVSSNYAYSRMSQRLVYSVLHFHQHLQSVHNTNNVSSIPTSTSNLVDLSLAKVSYSTVHLVAQRL
jgi:AAA family ATPase